MDHYTAWKRLAPLGLLAVGTGASVIGDAIIRKARREPAARWVVLGTAGLVVFNAGLCLFGDSVKHRTLYELGA